MDERAKYTPVTQRPVYSNTPTSSKLSNDVSELFAAFPKINSLNQRVHETMSETRTEQKDKFTTGIQEHNLIIESVDRDASIYPNPFDYRVYFGIGSSVGSATINKRFDNVKYIKLDTAVLPSTFYFVKQDTSLNEVDFDLVKVMDLESNARNSTFELTSTDVSGNFAIIDINDVLSEDTLTFTRKIKFCPVTESPNPVTDVYEFSFTFDSIGGVVPNDMSDEYPLFSNGSTVTRYRMKTFNIINDKYTLMYIDEFGGCIENTTSDAIKNSFSIMFPDSCYQGTVYASSKFIDKKYSFGDLGRIDQMSIKIKNKSGQAFKNSQENYVDTLVPSVKTCNCFLDSNGYFNRDYRCSCTYFRHPYYQKFQNTLIFKVGVQTTALNSDS